jgi:hypothetical protein
MWAYIIIGGHAVVAVVVAVWAAHVALKPDSKPATRAVAYKIFRLAWPAGALSGTATAMVKLHEAGFL